MQGTKHKRKTIFNTRLICFVSFIHIVFSADSGVGWGFKSPSSTASSSAWSVADHLWVAFFYFVCTYGCLHWQNVWMLYVVLYFSWLNCHMITVTITVRFVQEINAASVLQHWVHAQLCPLSGSVLPMGCNVDNQPNNQFQFEINLIFMLIDCFKMLSIPHWRLCQRRVSEPLNHSSF